MAEFYYAILRSDSSGRADKLFHINNDSPDFTPDPSGISLTAGQYAEWQANFTTRCWDGTGLVACQSDVAHLVSRATIILRLQAVGKLRAAYIALKLDDPVASISDAELVAREQWRSDAPIYSDNVSVRMLLDGLDLASVGSSTDAILAA